MLFISKLEIVFDNFEPLEKKDGNLHSYLLGLYFNFKTKK